MKIGDKVIESAGLVGRKNRRIGIIKSIHKHEWDIYGYDTYAVNWDDGEAEKNVQSIRIKPYSLKGGDK